MAAAFGSLVINQIINMASKSVRRELCSVPWQPGSVRDNTVPAGLQDGAASLSEPDFCHSQGSAGLFHVVFAQLPGVKRGYIELLWKPELRSFG